MLLIGAKPNAAHIDVPGSRHCRARKAPSKTERLAELEAGCHSHTEQGMASSFSMPQYGLQCNGHKAITGIYSTLAYALP